MEKSEGLSLQTPWARSLSPRKHYINLNKNYMYGGKGTHTRTSMCMCEMTGVFL